MDHPQCSFLPCSCVIAVLLLISTINREEMRDFYVWGADLQIGDVQSGDEQFQVIPLWFSFVQIQDNSLYLNMTLDLECLDIHIIREK